MSARELWFGNCSKHSELCFAVFTFADLCIFLSYPSFVLLSWLGSVGVVKSPFRYFCVSVLVTKDYLLTARIDCGLK